MQSPT